MMACFGIVAINLAPRFSVYAVLDCRSESVNSTSSPPFGRICVLKGE